jgi:rSAM/selenodomain-associated transferase 1
LNLTGLIIFIKNPELGKCKTRLAATIGDEKALIVYKKLLTHTRQVSLEVSVNRYLFYSEDIDFSDNWDNTQFKKHLQHSGDLGHRMQMAFSLVLESECKAIIIGSDCPEINPKIINLASESLENFDFVIGPTYDGGYYLLGMKSPSSFLFNDMEWSVESVFQETVSRIKKEGKTYTIIQRMNDLDNEEDLNKFPSFKA